MERSGKYFLRKHQIRVRARLRYRRFRFPRIEREREREREREGETLRDLTSDNLFRDNNLFRFLRFLKTTHCYCRFNVTMMSRLRPRKFNHKSQIWYERRDKHERKRRIPVQERSSCIFWDAFNGAIKITREWEKGYNEVRRIQMTEQLEKRSLATGNVRDDAKQVLCQCTRECTPAYTVKLIVTKRLLNVCRVCKYETSLANRYPCILGYRPCVTLNSQAGLSAARHARA